MEDLNVFQQFWYYTSNNFGYILAQFWRHFLVSAYGVLFASIVGVPLGILLEKCRKLAPWVFALANILQTVPALALMAIIMIYLGLGVNTLIVVIFLYSLLPIIRNTYTGMATLDPDVLEAATGMGMTDFQRLRMVEFPLALSVIMGGIRNALVVAVSIGAIGTFISAGGLGDIIVQGTSATNGAGIILAGALPTALMAIIVDVVLGWVEKRFTVSS